MYMHNYFQLCLLFRLCYSIAKSVMYLILHLTGMTKTKYIDAVLKGVNQAVAECNSKISVRYVKKKAHFF